MSEVNVNQLKAFGPGLSAGQTGKKCTINVSGASQSDLAEGLTLAVTSGKTKLDVITDYDSLNDDGYNEAYYVPLVSGEYKVTIRYNGKQLAGSPFTAKVIGDPIDAKKLVETVTVHGRAYELGKAYAYNEFDVDCSGLKPVIGGLKVHMKGPERSSSNLSIHDNKNGTFKIKYKPTTSGMYTLTIKIADVHIPGSPFTVKVTEFLSN